MRKKRVLSRVQLVKELARDRIGQVQPTRVKINKKREKLEKIERQEMGG